MRVLVVCQDITVLERVSRLLGDVFAVDAVSSKASCMDLLRQNDFEVVLAAERVTDGSGLELLGQIAQRWPRTLRIFAVEPPRRQLLRGRLEPFRLFRTVAYPLDEHELMEALFAAHQSLRGESGELTTEHIELEGDAAAPVGAPARPAAAPARSAPPPAVPAPVAAQVRVGLEPVAHGVRERTPPWVMPARAPTVAAFPSPVARGSGAERPGLHLSRLMGVAGLALITGSAALVWMSAPRPGHLAPSAAPGPGPTTAAAPPARPAPDPRRAGTLERPPQPKEHAGTRHRGPRHATPPSAQAPELAAASAAPGDFGPPPPAHLHTPGSGAAPSFSGRTLEETAQVPGGGTPGAAPGH